VNSVSAFRFTIAAVALAATVLGVTSTCAIAETKKSWDGLPVITMRGGLRIYWRVYTGKENNLRHAERHGFLPVTEVGTYSDYRGSQRENIDNFLGSANSNPWNKPPFFERVIKRNIDQHPSTSLYVHDIEFDFEEDAAVAWRHLSSRQASGAKDFAAFEDAYFREWASWFWLPVNWTKEKYPGTPVGIYGPQPFRRDYWGIADKSAAQIDGTHRTDWRLWQYIDPHVDFYIASIYVFYDRPDSVFYMAANVEENYTRTRTLGNKPVYAYEWLRYHDSNRSLASRELDPYLVEAMAIIPFFSGASGIVLWGYEPQMTRGEGRPYETLPLYMKNLDRVARLSEKIGTATLVIDEPAHVLWKQRKSLVRRLVVSTDECIVLAINPWQAEEATTTVEVTCGPYRHVVSMQGRHSTLVHISGNRVQAY
jgi:hypothetical protein